MATTSFRSAPYLLSQRNELYYGPPADRATDDRVLNEEPSDIVPSTAPA